MKHPMFALVVPFSSLEVGAQRFLDATGVLVMNTRQPFLRMVANGGVFIPEQCLPSRRPVHFVGQDVPVPEAVVCAPHRKCVSLFALVKVRQRPFVRQLSVDAGERQREVYWLRDVVVRAAAEGLDDVLGLCPGRHHDDWQFGRRVRHAQPTQDFEPAHAGHFHVQQHEIVLAVRHALQRLWTACRCLDQKPFLDETARQDVAVLLDVVDDEKRATARHERNKVEQSA